MTKNGVFFGKKILLMSNDPAVTAAVRQGVDSHQPVFYHSGAPRDALGLAMTKNPDLIIYDDLMPPFQGNKILPIVRRARPKVRILLLTQAGVPLRSIDVTAQGASFTINRDSSPEQIYNAVKHCLSISSVPRVEQMAS
ncbi:MAG: response regulator transcription factor [Candidatus Omnitrophica bacterium]|nr:response regulator transcription factor [Candidatus Omnitrophota bacterium]